MSMKTTILTFAFALLVLPTAGHTADDNGGFGASFANEGHAGLELESYFSGTLKNFETPLAYEETANDIALDGSALQDIEPAAGEELSTDAEIMHDEIHMDETPAETVIEDIAE